MGGEVRRRTGPGVAGARPQLPHFQANLAMLRGLKVGIGPKLAGATKDVIRDWATRNDDTAQAVRALTSNPLDRRLLEDCIGRISRGEQGATYGTYHGPSDLMVSDGTMSDVWTNLVLRKAGTNKKGYDFVLECDFRASAIDIDF